MKRTIVFLALNLMLANAIAQTPESPLITVHYALTHIVDTTQRNVPYKDRMILFLGKQSSLFSSYYIMRADSAIEAYERLHQTKAASAAIRSFGMPYGVYKNIKEDQTTNLASILGNFYVIKEDLPKQDWKISTETKDIQGYKCQKATTSFRGRNWEAWFCSALPYRNGPWKLGGLPGLILEAKDTPNEVIYTLESIDEKVNNNQAIALPSPVISTSPKDLKKLANAVMRDRAGQTGGGGGFGGGKSSGPPQKMLEYNNPIEKDQGD